MRPVNLVPSASPKKVVISAQQPIFVATISLQINSDVNQDGRVDSQDLHIVAGALEPSRLPPRGPT